jgi:hypothetical protein
MLVMISMPSPSAVEFWLKALITIKMLLRLIGLKAQKVENP